MRLIAKKPCSFGGKKFFIGDEIPAEYVVDPAAQEKRRVLAVLGEGEGAEASAPSETTVSTVELTIKAEEGLVAINPSVDGIQAVFDCLGSTVEEAEEIIAQMTDGDALILLHTTDSRKGVKTAAETRAKELAAAEEPEATEEEGDQ